MSGISTNEISSLLVLETYMLRIKTTLPIKSLDSPSELKPSFILTTIDIEGIKTAYELGPQLLSILVVEYSI